MIENTDTDIQFVYSVEDLKKDLHNASAYLVRKYGMGIPFKDEDSDFFFDQVLIKSANDVLHETIRIAKTIATPLEFAPHTSVETDAVIFLIENTVANMDRLLVVDKRIEAALKSSNLFYWFQGTDLESNTGYSKEITDSSLRTAVIGVRSSVKPGRDAGWF